MTSISSAQISASQPLLGTIAVPGDKSISHRSLMLASQALGVCHIRGLLEGEDVLATAAALRQMGVQISQEKGEWVVVGNGLGALHEPDGVLDLGNSGTSVRLLMGLLAPYHFTAFFTGDASLRRRPMARAMHPLQQMGARFISHSGDRLPCALMGGDLLPITYTLPVPSAQVKSAVILAGLNTAGITTVIEPEPSRDHTERMLQFLGFPCVVEEITPSSAVIPAKAGIQSHLHETPAFAGVTANIMEGRKITIRGQQQTKRQMRIIEVPGDPSSAAFPLVAALITPGSTLRINNVGMNPHRTGLFTTLQEMGAKLTFHNPRSAGGEEVADIEVTYSELTGITVPASRAPSMIDEYPILAIAAAFAQGQTVMHGLAELRVKESNRLEKILNGLLTCGIQAKVEGDTLTVTGTSGKVAGGVTIDSAMDHRIAMSFLILGLRSAQPIHVTGTDTIATSFPNFFATMRNLGVSITSLGASVTEQGEARSGGGSVAGGKTPLRKLVIAIDGPAASGKGTLARRLANHLGLVYLDTGSLYRAVGMKLVYDHKDPADKDSAIAAARSINLNDLQNPRLRQERIGQAASVVSAIPEVRQALLEFQRNTAANPQGAVLDGRDIGTVICPDADCKFFIQADIHTRAKRRHRELEGEGVKVDYTSVLEDLQERDERDSKRSAAPLVPAPDAIQIDTSTLSADEVFAQVLAMVEREISTQML